jgi:hypothetical protein
LCALQQAPVIVNGRFRPNAADHADDFHS